MNPVVSVIIPAYNTEKYIGKAIESVLQQTLDNLEIIVVDDASTDATLALAKSFSDPRVKVLTNPENLGAAAARNRAIRAATGKWIALLDSDDWYAPYRLEKLLAVANSQPVDMVADDIYHINDGEEFPWSTLFRESGEKFDEIMQIEPVFFVESDLPGVGGLTLGLTKPIIKREFLLKHRIEYLNNIRLGQDFWFYLSCLANGARFYIIPQAYYFYRSRPGALTKKTKIERLNQFVTANLCFSEQPVAKKNPQLLDALSKRITKLEKIRSYFIVVDAIKQGEFLNVLLLMRNNPYFFLHFINQLPRILSRRWNYFLAKLVH
ncbi:glycosyltransferase family 2 protein [Anabaena lutea]|uniref:Glycosyltransferase family 2 protein n=1 Tax=Anabaena lutea FACHB-196 TaxID=2692881 RepID=A0ABR8FCT2_9NOST|nr:glycosyltransferase family 2 protein [Anabaena lutea]MBD2567398.1 glycosyltransferase family 2 protein [Anabaena lutea FACHB-196]